MLTTTAYPNSDTESPRSDTEVGFRVDLPDQQSVSLLSGFCRKQVQF